MLPTLVVAASGCDERRGGDPTLATVYGQAVTRGDAENAVAVARLEGEAISVSEARDTLVDEALIAHEAEALGVKADEEIVDRRVAAAEDAVGGSAMLDHLLSKAGVSRERFREHARAIVLAEALGNAKFKKERAGDAAARTYFARNRDLFSVPETVKLGVIQARTKGPIRASRQEIRRGASFAEAARRHTADDIARQQGGLQGWVSADSLPGPLGDAVDELRPGEVTGMVEGPGGWYLLTIYGRRPARDPAFTEVRDRIIDQLTRERRVAALGRWLESQRSSAAVDVE